MTDYRPVLEHDLARVGPAPFTFDDVARRRDRKRRNQRISAGVVGMAVFVAAVWIVTTGGPFDRARTPVPGGGETGPVVAPYGPGKVGLVGLAPEGATPSLPSRGELVLSATFMHAGEGNDSGRFSFMVYADGRLIWHRLGGGTGEYTIDYTTGTVEQRLTPEGVELLLSEVLSTGLFDQDVHLVGGYIQHPGEVRVRNGDRLVRVTWSVIGTWSLDGTDNAGTETAATPEQVNALKELDARLANPAAWLPATAWEDEQMRPFVPSRYSLCVGSAQLVELARVLASLPQRAQDLLDGWDLTYREHTYSEGRDWCSAVTTERARALAEVLDEADIHSSDDMFGLYYDSGPRNGSALNVGISFEPMLPDWP
jgi:hypothetical protein